MGLFICSDYQKGPETDDVIKEADLKIEKSKNHSNLDILDDREKEVVVGRFGLDTGERSVHSGRTLRSSASAAATCRGSKSGRS